MVRSLFPPVDSTGNQIADATFYHREKVITHHEKLIVD
jgi:hypothetical protein